MTKKQKFTIAQALIALSSVAMTNGALAAAAKISPDVLTGVVTSTKGPEAGVWVIAETKDLPTRYIKIVVTDDQGRYLLPQLPNAKYSVWVRGYGLVDSKQVEATPGASLNLKAEIAPDAKAAAQYYPADSWLALMQIPKASEFPGTGPKGNGIPPTFKTQQDYVSSLKSRCMLCHQQGTKATRELADNSIEGWYERLKAARGLGDQTVGNHGQGISVSMLNGMTSLGQRGLAVFTDWTQRIEKGEVPPAPPRPEGVERNLVLTVRDWAFGRALHDEISTDKRNPSVNAGGWVYAAAPTTGHLEYVDPKTNKVGEIQLPPLPGKDAMNVYPHNPMIDAKGRVWVTDFGQYTLPSYPASEKSADFCANPSLSKYAKYYPTAGETRDKRILAFDPTTETTASIPSCYGVHHLGFGYDKQDTLFFSGDANVVGWIETKAWDDTKDASKAVGWCPTVLDTKQKAATGPVIITPDRTQWNQPGARGPNDPEAAPGSAEQVKAADPNKDTRINGGGYGLDVAPNDNAVWLARISTFPGGLVRLERGANPPETCKAELYISPKRASGGYAGVLSKGVSIDSKGMAWTAFNSGAFGKFDRSKCKVTRGPTATGEHCQEGWTLYEIPGPKMANSDSAADMHYLNWMDLFDTFGLGKDIPMAPGSNSDSIVALLPDTGKVLHFRVPYPRGFFGRGLDGRIDDPKAGWKGKGLWGAFAMTPAFHQEGGDEGMGPEVVHFQLRSNPLEE